MAKSPLAVKRKATLSAYEPSLREKAAILGEKGFKVITGREPGYEARENINRYTGLLDMLDLPGIALSADDFKRNLASKQYAAAAGDIAGLAVGAIPIAGGALKKGAKKVVKEGVEGAGQLIERYGAEYVPEIADRVATQLQKLGADIKVGSPYKTSHGTSIYISPKDESIYHAEGLNVPQVRISDHSGGWGERRGPGKPIGFDLATPKTEEEIQTAITNIINSGKSFYDIPGAKSDIAKATELAIKNAKITNQNKALEAYEKNIKNGSKNNRKSAMAQARVYDKDFVPPNTPEDLAAKYADPKSVSIEDWQWRPQEDVRADLGDLSEVPPHVVDFGNFMAEQSGKAAKGQMSPRDLIKAYGITRSSIQRQAIPLATAEKRGLKLDQLGLDMVRPEGAFAEWMGTPAGQAYLDAAERGVVHGSAIEDLTKKFAPFGFQNTLGDNLTWAAENLPQHGGYVPEAIAAAREGSGLPADWSDFVRKNLHGIDAAKAGFVGSMLGRGDLPTLDARQLVLQTGRPSKEGAKYQSRRGGLGSVEGVKRLSGRMSDLNLSLPEELRPYYQHLAHHSVWDKVGDEVNTHADLMNAMRNYAKGGPVEGDNLVDKYEVR